MKNKSNPHYKSKFLTLYVLVLATLLSSCTQKISNIKSIQGLKENKLLAGRFLFYNNNKLANIREVVKEDGGKEYVTGFSVLFKKEGEKAKKLELDENGYAYIPVSDGQYYINRIKHHSTWHGTRRFSLLPNTGIKINSSDSVVNFGTIKVEFKHSTASKTAGIIEAVLFPESLFSYLSPASLRVNQTSDWGVPCQYISAKFGISPKSIRDEIVKFPEREVDYIQFWPSEVFDSN